MSDSEEYEIKTLLRCLPRDPNVAIKVVAQVMIAIIGDCSEQPEADLARMYAAMMADLNNKILRARYREMFREQIEEAAQAMAQEIEAKEATKKEIN